MIDQAISLGQGVGAKVNPLFSIASEKVAGYINVSAVNLHLIFIGAISMYLAHILAGRELKLKFWIISGLLFWLFTYLGF